MVLDRLRPNLRVFRIEGGRELFDLPDTPLADADAPAPPRFLPEFDNALLSHGDRSRIVSDEHRRRLSTTRTMTSFLVDGFVRGTWSIAMGAGGPATLLIEPFQPLSKPDEAELIEEGLRLLSFVHPDAGHEVRVGRP